MTPIRSYVTRTRCLFYSNISQLLLLHKIWGNYHKFDSAKSLRLYYWHVKIPQCRYMEHGLKDTVMLKNIYSTSGNLLSPTSSRQPAWSTHILWDSSVKIFSKQYSRLPNRSVCMLTYFAFFATLNAPYWGLHYINLGIKCHPAC